jgi:hypothetical protein
MLDIASYPADRADALDKRVEPAIAQDASPSKTFAKFIDLS